jgi:hypothetical protein
MNVPTFAELELLLIDENYSLTELARRRIAG